MICFGKKCLGDSKSAKDPHGKFKLLFHEMRIDESSISTLLDCVVPDFKYAHIIK